MKTPLSVAVSPGRSRRVSSPVTRTVMARGMCPMGTWSADSWILTSWYLTNLDPRVMSMSGPVIPACFICSLGTVCGRNVLPGTSW